MIKKKEENKKIIWPEIGQDRVKLFLEKSILNNKIAQSYIFLGPSDLGKSTLALAFARNLLASDNNFTGDLEKVSSGANSDLHILKVEEGKRQISIEQAREFMKMLNFSSFLNSYKIGIIKEADKLSPEAKSALLKTLEEPKEKVIIILLVTELNNLPETIISRAQVVRFYPLSSEFIYNYLLKNGEEKRSRAKAIASLSLGRLLKAKKFQADNNVYEEELEKAKILLDFFDLDLAQRRQVLDNYLKGAETFKIASLFILTWEALWRDLMLIAVNKEDLIFYQDLKEELINLIKTKKEKEDNFLNYLISLRNDLKMAEKYLQANVNPINSLLSFVYNI